MEQLKSMSTVPSYEYLVTDPELKEIISKYEKQIRQIADAYTEDCIRNNIETFSAYGWFLQTAYAALGIAMASKGCKYRIKRREKIEANGEHTL